MQADTIRTRLIQYLQTVTSRPGVYRMLDEKGEILYVGKARNLKKRVSSYFRKTGLDNKTLALVNQINEIQITVTHTEGEALLLENNLIKEYKPRYNILLRDDKSYPYIYLSSQHKYPALALHRGAKKKQGKYFGPYPSAGSVRESLNLLQKLFLVRQCDDTFFSNRSRPCLQYQIKRCSGPCVGHSSPEDYAEDVKHTVLFLDGKSQAVSEQLIRKMEQASGQLDYEQAARLRDQIASLHRVQEKQYISSQGGDFDIIACDTRGNRACIQVFQIRGGRNLGNTAFYPLLPQGNSPWNVMTAFLSQYYIDKTVPPEIILSHEAEDQTLLETAFTGQAGYVVHLSTHVRGRRARWIAMARNNARHALDSYLGRHASFAGRLQSLTMELKLDDVPKRIECFDISHTRGESTVASCVVFGREGAIKSDYRRFNIRDIQAGDDYAAMEQALLRRYTRLLKGEGKLPDLLLIDGGKGQLSSAEKVLHELQLTGMRLIGVSKGPGRKPGLETLHISGENLKINLASDSPALHLVQQIRDEAHRFAITGHRQQRGKKRRTSTLEQIAGIGPKRRRRLLQQMGGLQEVARAGVDDLVTVKGISKSLAQDIYDTFHGD